jgi:hypothetical protein
VAITVISSAKSILIPITSQSIVQTKRSKRNLCSGQLWEEHAGAGEGPMQGAANMQQQHHLRPPEAGTLAMASQQKF